MGFNSVYRCLQEVFPKVDYRLLKAVAIEHSSDADQAVDVVLTEIIPYLSSRFIGSASPPEHHEVGLEQMDLLSQQQVIDKADVGPSLQPQSVACSNAMETDQSSGFLHADAAPLVEALNGSTVSDFYDANDGNEQSCGYTENEEVILLGKTQENGVKLGKNEIVHATSDALLHGGNGYQRQICGSTESEELISWGTHEESDLEIRSDAEPPGMPISLISEKDGVSGIVNGLDHECEDLPLPLADDSNTLNNHEAGLCLDSTEVRNSVSQLGPTPINRRTPVTSSSLEVTSNQANFTFERNDIEAEPEMDTTDTRSGQECKIHLLEEMIEDAKNNKKTLFSAMERVINMMREVELQEKAAEQAKEEASRGGLDILVKVEEMKQMLVHAKEANDMHAGEVYGEKAILATEVRELQSRLLCLSDERDKSLAILDEMHQTLEARLATAKDLMEAAEQERLEKEESARNALFEQEAVMEKVVEESEMLEEEAEENSRLREFLMNRGRTVDILQGEISVICQDVRLLKEKFDDRVPLSKSVSSSQTSCILATSGSSGKSMASDLVHLQCNLASSGSSVKSVEPDLVPVRSLPSSGSSPKSVAPVLVPEQGESLKTPKSMSPSPSVDRLSSDGRFEEERARTDHQALLDEGWEFFDKDTELVF